MTTLETKTQTEITTNTKDVVNDRHTDPSKKMHPLDSPSLLSKICHYVFHLWVFNIIKIGLLKFSDIPPTPKILNPDDIYHKWKETRKHRVDQHLPVNISSLIYHHEKYTIYKLIILGTIEYTLILYAYYLFKTNLWPLMSDIDENNFDFTMFLSIAQYSGYIFLLFTLKSVIYTHCLLHAEYLSIRILSSLCCSVYEKTLRLDISECDKQTVLGIVGADIHQIETGLWYLLTYGVPVICVIILSIIALFYLIGIASLFGIAFFIFIGIPFQLYGGFKLSHYGKLRMKCSDKRVQLISELLRGIRILKCNAYEMPLMDRINEYRKNELKHIIKRNFYLGLLILSNFVIPSALLCISLIVYNFVFGYEIDSEITLFMIMILTVTAVSVKGVPIVTGYVSAFIVSCARVDKFMAKKSIDLKNTESGSESNNCEDNIAIEINNGDFVWTETDKNETVQTSFLMKDICLKINKGKLVAVIGSVGSGKTSLFQAILGEMECVNDKKINIASDNITYCSQTPYIRNVTLRENIIMELEYSEEEYKKCIAAACLLSDLKKLPNSDLTIIGEEGVNLSGGQCMRVAFARSLYRKNIDSDLYLFDDPLSSVDIYVGKKMFFNGIYDHLLNHNGENRNRQRTCLMVINSHLHLLKYFDEVIILDKGRLMAHTTIKQLFDNDCEVLRKYQHLLPTVNQINSDDGQQVQKDDLCTKNIDFHPQNINSLNIDRYEKYNNPDISSHFMEFVRASLSTFDYKTFWETNKTESKPSRKDLIILFIPLVIYIIIQLFIPICDIWLLVWNQHSEDNTQLFSHYWYLAVWFVFLSVIAFGTLQTMRYIGSVSCKASNYIHCKALYNILRAKTLFFDITPRGDTINRFTTDTDEIDIDFPIHCIQFILFASTTVGYFILIIFIIPYSLIPLIIILPIIFYLSYKLIPVFISVCLLRKGLKGPIMTLFTETITNLDSIRSYKLQNYFVSDLKQRLNDWTKCKFMVISLYSWSSFYQEMLLNTLQVLVIFVSVLQIVSNNIRHHGNNKQFIILSCWYFMGIQQQLSIVVNQYCRIREKLCSAKRLMEYHNLANIHEPKQVNCEYTIPDDIKDKWPERGNINISELKLKYRPNFDIVLNIDKNIAIKHGQKIGVCGRTGSGKSSILVSIFRLFEPVINDTEIDNLKIDQLGLYDLRSNLSVIWQNPTLFHGSLRFNLDPFDKYTDTQVWNALRDVKLFELINNREGQLMCNVDDNGSNFSLGQKQLLCFARAILKDSCLIFMDEATSSIDKNTDEIIQQLIRCEKFKNKTVICIAHRIQTIIDYDYVLLLNNGKVQQFDTPKNLLDPENEDKSFINLVKTNKLYFASC